MTKVEYETELKALYELAIKQKDVGMALELLERSRTMGFENIRTGEERNGM